MTSAETVRLLHDREIAVPVQLAGCRLIPGYTGALTLPLEAGLKLYAVCDGAPPRRIASPSDLSTITTEVSDAAAALAFVRLFTGPETYFLFDEAVVEVDRQEQPYAVRVDAALPLTPSSVDVRAEEFRVHRDVAKLGAADAAVVRRSESVRRRGEYHLLADAPLGSVPRAALALPQFE